MSIEDLLTILFLIPNFFILFLFRKETFNYFKIYRKKKNPNYPLLPRETLTYLHKDPINFFKNLPLIPVKMWKIIFERHSDEELNKAAGKARKILLIFYVYDFLFILFVFLLSYFNFV